MIKPTNLRITSGIFRGRAIASPQDSATHPMGAREKIALFNILQPYLDSGTILLDAYAGSGALGIEALSRGVKKVVFIEKNPKVAQIIYQNLQKLQVDSEVYEVLTCAIEKAAENLPREKFDCIIADPPYNNFSEIAIEKLVKLLKNNGILVLSHPNTAAKLQIPGLELLKTRSYAAAQISLYQKN